jgi:hypothetical protein
VADLQQVVGAILRDLAKARFGSDLYSRSIARYYENDYLLRKFPVPRSDVEEVEVDLKFSLADVHPSHTNTEGRESNVAVLLERTVEELVATLLDVGRDFLEDPQNAELRETFRQHFSKGFNSTVLRIELRQKALRYFIESYTHLISQAGDFDHKTALRGLRRPMFWGFNEYRNDGVTREEIEAPLDTLLDAVFDNKNFSATLASLEEPIKQIWQQHYDARLEVEIEGHRLAELSDAAISTIKIKATVRNMIWTEVKVDERKTTHALTSD